MPQTTQHQTKFRHHKATGQGLVELNGRRIYLGRYDLPATAEKYRRLVAEWGVVTMPLLVLTGGTLTLARRRRHLI